MSKYTPGPWVIRGISQEDGSISFGSEKHRIIIGYVTNAASIGDFVNESLERGTFGSLDRAHTQWANARLCTAAPEMHSALTEALAYFESREDIIDNNGGPQVPNEEMRMASAIRAAIAKATATAA